ncbi:SURF1 family protein [Azoarcus sp. PA01]|nr:SURF1 family protein [Azoarcus sp. PA01]
MIFGRVHPLPLVAGVALALLTAQLGSWQLGRAAEKTALQARIASAAASAPVSPSGSMPVAEWQPVRLHGEWVAAATIYLDNRIRRGRPGYEVLTPLRLAGDAGWVLVNRGWIAAGPDRAVLPDAAPAAGAINLAGIARVPPADPFTLAPEAAQGRVWQYLDIERYRALSGLAVRDWIVQQTSAAADSLQRDWPRPDAGIDRHRGYALQWYSLAGLSLVMTGVYVFRRLRS